MLKGERGEKKVQMQLHVILLCHPSAARCVVPVLGPVLGPPGSSDALIFRGVREWGSGNSSTDPSSVLAGKDPPWPGICVAFNDSLLPKENLQ